jgi:hypothetical protein
MKTTRSILTDPLPLPATSGNMFSGSDNVCVS